MINVKWDSILKAGAASLAFAAIALVFVPTAGAQAMGEYGLAVGHSAGAAAAAPHAELPAIPGTSVQSGPSGSTTTEIRGDDSSDRDTQARDDSNSQPTDDWTEVKGSDDGEE
jgi:hypothetical protein